MAPENEEKAEIIASGINKVVDDHLKVAAHYYNDSDYYRSYSYWSAIYSGLCRRGYFPFIYRMDWYEIFGAG
jgi:hypothetical protein